ncbi:ATP-binding protein [Aspergillus mulundensis]|uniref:AAA+ ATPase domain-containing protein n=1 Tax=Aspergillus mulundensis TaxID=1810919 RepID=A0A3D8SK84_9EURO|nr:Uncharacterized protein DSM5745_03256 [Aspergillus mulundensis]RDW86614.1 Uncharacterized protein DSM5745_03256 [Aspergillus mulundensis]
MACPAPSTPIPPPPPPMPPAQLPLHQASFPANESDSEALELPFKAHGSTKENTEYEFPKLSENTGSVSLRAVIGQYLGSPNSRRTTARQLFHILGRLRCLRRALEAYNSGLPSQSAEFVQYWRHHTVSLLSGFGFRPASSIDPAPLTVTGLPELICHVETLFAQDIAEAQELLQTGFVSFDGLGELFRPDNPVKATTGIGNQPPVFRVLDSFYQERRNVHGTQRLFHVNLEVVVPVGDHFSVAAFSEVIPAWGGARVKKLSEFAYQPVTPQENEYFQTRGDRCAELGTGSDKYLAYSAHSFFMHGSRPRGTASMAQGTNSSVSLTGGRIMVDMARGASLGHYPCQGVDEVSLAIISLSRRYQAWVTKRSSAASDADTELLTVWKTVPYTMKIYCWPYLVGFSFTAKAWGHVAIGGLSRIAFAEDAFNLLVLPPERKQLLHAVVRHGTAPQAQPPDLITSKQGGLIFLLHGPPGVGKTLTAEAVAEVLHRPVYHITMGELGLTPDELESRLSDVLALCSKWNAIAILDEADVFLETRSTSDFVRNAMVCVMLRILEYHPGILFLTTNRVRSLDPAFESRITVAMRYEGLDRGARREVWRNQLGGIAVAEDIDCEALAERVLNGRQIKNAVRLALCLAAEKGEVLSQGTLLETLEITAFARRNMGADNGWEDSLNS